VAGRAYLSYSQSYSLVKFLLETYGREEMNSLLLQLRDGVAIEEALQAVYGFDVDGLEDAWRAAIGAKPRAQDAQPTARPSPTVVPTIIPFAGVSSEQMQATQVSMGLPTATAIPTSNPAAVATPAAPVSRTSWGLVGLGGLAAGCIVGLIGLGLVVYVLTRGRSRQT
jgi:hypothetical protein